MATVLWGIIAVASLCAIAGYWIYRLRCERDLARRALDARAALLSQVSYDIRTPMSGIIGMNGLLLLSRLNEEQTEYAETVQTSAESLLAMLDNLLDYSKLDEGPVKLSEVDFDLFSVIEDVVDHHAPWAARKNLMLTYHVSRDLPHVVHGDPVRLRQILDKLLNNAIKFTQTGEVALMVRRVAGDPGETVLHFDVMDTGIGIAPELRARIMGLGRADLRAEHGHGGAGLGLAICRRLVEATGGCLDFQSEADKGSTFFFLMPFRNAESGEVDEHQTEVLRGITVRVIHSSFYVQRMLDGLCEVCGAKLVAEDATAEFELRESLEPEGIRRPRTIDVIREGLHQDTIAIPCRARHLAIHILAAREHLEGMPTEADAMGRSSN